MFAKEREAALEWLASLIQHSKFSIAKKTTEEMWEIVIGDRSNISIRHSAFKCIAYLIINGAQKLSRSIQNVFISVITENSSKMIEIALVCLLSIKSDDIPYSVMACLSSINTFTEEYLIKLIKIMKNYVKSNNDVPQELIARLASESSHNSNEDIRKTWVKLLISLKERNHDMPQKIIDYIELENKLMVLNTSSDSKEIKSTLKALYKTDFSSTPWSVSLLNTILVLLKNEDNNEYVASVIKFVSKLNDDNIRVTHEFIDGVMSQYKRYKNYEKYIELLRVFIQKYDQYNNPKVMKYALKALSKASEYIQSLWFKIMSDLSKRNVNIDEDYLSKLLDIANNENENSVFKVICNSVEKFNEVSSTFIDRISELFLSKKYQLNIWKVLVKVTKKSAKISDKLIKNLLKYSQKDTTGSKLIFEIFMNLRDRGHKLPDEAKAFGDFIQGINILYKDDNFDENEVS